MAGVPRFIHLVALCVPMTLLGLSTVDAQERQPRPSLALDSLAGADNFDRYCAPCHGADGRGNGPVAPALKAMPSDLTSLTERSGGVFPRERVTSIITGTGRQPDVHGSGDMPVWGPIFRALDPSDARTKARVNNVVTYVERLQVRPRP